MIRLSLHAESLSFNIFAIIFHDVANIDATGTLISAGPRQQG